MLAAVALSGFGLAAAGPASEMSGGTLETYPKWLAAT